MRVVTWVGLGVACVSLWGCEGQLKPSAPAPESGEVAQRDNGPQEAFQNDTHHAECSHFAAEPQKLTAPRKGNSLRSSALVTPQPLTVSLTYDDGVSDGLVGAELMDSHGFKGTFYVIGGRIGYPGAMTLAQVRALEANGHEIGGHTLSHADLTAVASGDVERQICDDRNVLLSYGFNIQSFAYPFGNMNSVARGFAQSCGYTSARTVGPLEESDEAPSTESIPPTDRFAIRTTWSVRPTTTLDQMKQWITDGEAVGGWTTIVFHRVCEAAPCPDYGITRANLAAFIDWLATRPTVTVKTVRDVTGGSSLPLVQAANPVLNPSFESDIDPVDGVVDYWGITFGWGTSTKTLSRVSPGRTGTYAAKLDVSAFTNGLALLSPLSNKCTPPAVAGRRYILSAWYKASAAPKWSLYYRDQNGTWLNWVEGPAQATSDEWRYTSFTTPLVPANATAVSFGLGLTGVGSITADDFALTDATQTVSSSTTLTSNPNPSDYGQTVVLTATVSGGAVMPAGTVTFQEGGTVLGTATLDPTGKATFSFTGFGSGNHPITAYYGGSANHSPSTSATVSQLVTGFTTTTTVTSSINPSSTGQSTTFTATVISGTGIPAGTVNFLDGSAVIGSGTLGANGKATFYTSALTTGSHAITASYPGSDGHGASTSAVLTQTVGNATALLQNPSFEALSSTAPSCWQRSNFGNNSTVFGRVSDAHEGTAAERIDVTAYVDGGARTLPKQDTGLCAPAAVPGKSYTVKAWYKSDVRPVWVVWYRSAAGVWTWWAQSPALTPVAAYTETTFTTPALPAGATHVSFALSLYASGYLVSDDYTLTASP